MSRLELAAERLARAVETLESAAAPLAKVRDNALDSQKRLTEFLAEREKLLERIASLEDEVRSLSGITEEVEGRLDGAIAEIRAALGR